MSTNCIHCGIRKRTGFDLQCDYCRQFSGPRFFDIRRNCVMMLVMEGHWKGWICYRHSDGNWVSLREATKDDYERLAIPLSDWHAAQKQATPSPPTISAPPNPPNPSDTVPLPQQSPHADIDHLPSNMRPSSASDSTPLPTDHLPKH
jgi:hypothetical protein